MNFLNLTNKKLPYNQAKAVILPVPFGGTGRTPGMEKGPEAILHAWQMLSAYDAETNTDLNELSLLTLDPIICPEQQQEVDRKSVV